MNYCLGICIDPLNHTLYVKGKIKNSVCHEYYLNENFVILGAWSKGEKIPFRMQREEPHPAFDVVSRPVIFETQNDEVEFEYEGKIPEMIADINHIDQHIIELASYSGWYPKPKDSTAVFDFALTVKFPDGYEVASNGKCLDGGKIRSITKENDIVLFASDLVKRFEYIAGSVTCTFLCPSYLIPKIEQWAKNLVTANELFSQTFGRRDTGDGTEIVSVFRPRGGWGYKRGNATFRSAEGDGKEDQDPEDFHELAHGWWCIANVETDDWINEGGAEFSAYLASKEILGENYAWRYRAQCMDKIRGSVDHTSIADTDYKSASRYLNHYIKTTVMYLNAQKQFGDERVFGLLKKVYTNYKNTRNATTSNFLSLCDKDMQNFFRTYLFATDWNQLNYQI